MVVVSYVFDWVIIAVAAAIGYVLGEKTPNKRPFSLHDPNISYVKPERFLSASFRLAIFFMVVMLRRTNPPDSPLQKTKRYPSGWPQSSVCSLPSYSSPSFR